VFLLLVKARALSRVEAREDAARVASKICCLSSADRIGDVDVALGVVVVVAGFRVDAAHRADHLGGEQHVLHRDHRVQQVDAGLVVDAGVEEDVLQQVVFSSGFFISCARPRKRPQW
jgi:hypothetical protein